MGQLARSKKESGLILKLLEQAYRKGGSVHFTPAQTLLSKGRGGLAQLTARPPAHPPTVDSSHGWAVARARQLEHFLRLQPPWRVRVRQSPTVSRPVRGAIVMAIP